MRSSSSIVFAIVSQIVHALHVRAGRRVHRLELGLVVRSTCPRVSSDVFVSFCVFRKYTFPGSSCGSANGGWIVHEVGRRELLGRLHQPEPRLLVEVRVVGEPDHDRARVRRRSRTSSLPQNSASITAAAITVLPAPVVAVSDDRRSPAARRRGSQLRARSRFARRSSTASAW